MKKIASFLGLFLLISIWAQADLMYVTVVDTDGSAVPQKSDINLKIDKKDVPVMDFVSIDTANPSVDTWMHPAGRRQYFLVYDLMFNSLEEVAAARRTTEILLSKISKEDLVCIASFGKKTGFRVLSGLTNDRNKINIGLNLLGVEKIEGMVQGPDGNYYSLQFSAEAHKANLIPEPKFLENIKNAQAVEEKKQKVEPSSIFVAGLSELAYSMANIEGRKHIILFTPGFDTKDAKIQMTETSFSDQYVDSAIRDDTYIGTPEEERAKEEDRRRQERESAYALGSSVQVDGIPEFVAGAGAVVDVISPALQDYDFFKKLTISTHGKYLRQIEDPSVAVDQILTQDLKYYAIGFDGRNEKEFKKAHDLKLTAAGRDLPAASSWVAPKMFSQYSQLDRRFHVSEALYKNYEAPTIGENFWADFVYQQGTPRVPTFAQLNGTNLIKKDVNELILEFHSFVVDSEGSIIDFTTVPVRLDMKNKQLRERVEKAGLKIWGMLLAHQGTGNIRWILVDPQFGDTTTRTAPIEIKGAELTTSYPFFPSENFDWIIWPKPQDSQSKRGVVMQYPYSMGSEQMFFPDLTPTIQKAKAGQVVYFKIYNKSPQAKNPPIKLELLDQSGKAVEIEQFALLQKPRDLEQGGMELFWKLQALPDVPPGNYQFKVNIRDTSTNKEVIRIIPTLIQ
jgi:hypothetical protein